MQHKFAGRFAIILASVLIPIFLGILPIPRLLDRSIPWRQKLNLKPGIDISGGTKLLYEIKTPPGGASEDLSTRVADALKKRVDPEGVRNLIWRPQGPTRLEIQMPMTEGSGVAGKARKEFSEAGAALSRTNIRLSEVRAALKLPDLQKREEALKELAMGSPRRMELFHQLADQTKALEEATRSKDVQRKVDTEDAITKTELAIDATNLPVQRIQADLDLFQSQIEKAQKRGNKQEVAGKQQERAAKIAAIKAEFPGFEVRQKAIDELVARYDQFVKIKGKLDDAEELKRMLRGSGVLEFHILVTDPAEIRPMAQRLAEQGPTPRAGDTSRWYEVERPDEMKGHQLYPYGDKQWVLAYTTPDKQMIHQEGAKPWALQQATRGFDSMTGRNVVDFELDNQGALLFGELSGNNLKKPLAIMLDDKVISAPTLQSRIEGRGQISGNYTNQDLEYLIRTLNAGSLPARLNEEPISEQTVGPTLGADNLRRGFNSSIIAVLAVAVFMIGYYHYGGFIATIAVVMNLIIQIGVLAMFNATFTLPGIAALALTVGMAVDANVLIFERLREEQHRGLSLRLALRNAYDRAFSAILDSNVTTVITSMLLYWFGSEEIKGFGLTLTIGVTASMFTALFVTRTIFDYGVDHMGLKHMGSLPLSFPKIDKFLRPNWDWMGKARWFYGGSAIAITVGLTCFILKGRDMFDIEFRSGTSAQVELKDKIDTQHVRDRVEDPRFRAALPGVQVVTVGNTGRDFEIITANENAPQVRDAVITALGDLLKVEIPSKFVGGTDDFEQAIDTDKVVLPVTEQPLTVGGFTPSTGAYVGGVAIVLKDIQPQLSPREIFERIERIRLEPGSNLPYRDTKIESPERDPNKPTSLAVVLIADPGLDYGKNPDSWRENLARPMWKMVKDAVGRQAQLRGVTNFNPSVANDMKINATVALIFSLVGIAIYLWVRFGNMKYGGAAILSLIHDVLISIGLIGITPYIADTLLGRALLIEPLRMNLTLVAAILTVIGYSVNDTIIVFDRIRENRGKFGHLDAQVINDSINQTFSRTMLTSSTAIATLLVMYILGGPGIHGFTFGMLFGIVTGTYSSIAIASPVLLWGGKDLIAQPNQQPKPVPVRAQRALGR